MDDWEKEGKTMFAMDKEVINKNNIIKQWPDQGEVKGLKAELTLKLLDSKGVKKRYWMRGRMT